MIGKSRGFSLIEMLAAMGIFSIVVLVSTTVFAMILMNQKRILGLKRAQEESRYIIEFLHKEARMAQYGSGCAGDGVLYNTSGDQLRFLNSQAKCVTYKLSGNRLQRNNLAMNSNQTIISNLAFSSANNLLNYSFDISGSSGKATININSSVASRAF